MIKHHGITLADHPAATSTDTPPALDRAADVLVVRAGPRAKLPIADHLARTGQSAMVVDDVSDALRVLSGRPSVVCLVDLSQDRGALTFIRLVRARYPAVVMAAVVDVTNPAISAEALQMGVVDLLPWPFEASDLALVVANARDQAVREPGTRASASTAAVLFAQSPAMRTLLSQIDQAAGSHEHVTIAGEPATGRSLVARALHARAGGSAERFIAVDCGTGEPHALERSLFGGVIDARDLTSTGPGSAERLAEDSAIHRASGGTLYLRNITEAPARLQSRLARLLRDREATLDGCTTVPIDVRVMISLEPDVDTLVADRRLHADLAGRVSHLRVDVPPFRRRSEDIPLLVVHVAGVVAAAEDLLPRSFSRAALALLSALPWPGNADQLESLVGVLSRSVTKRVVQIEDVLAHVALDGIGARADTGGSLREARARFERECISAMLVRHHGRVGDAAKALGIQRTNLYRKVRQLNVSRALLSSKR